MTTNETVGDEISMKKLQTLKDVATLKEGDADNLLITTDRGVRQMSGKLRPHPSPDIIDFLNILFKL